MKMTDAAFEARMTELRAAIATLPADQQPALEALARETEERHAANRANIDAARDGARQLAVLQEVESLRWDSVLGALQRLHPEQ